MKKYLNIILLISSLGLYSCEKFLEPGRYNDLYEEDIHRDPTYAEGLLMTAYNGLPNDYYFYYDVASDDAVTNLDDSQYKRMATGEWSSQYYPGSPWSNAYTQIFYINKFLSVYESVKYSVDVRNTPAVNAKRDLLHKKRLKGEAYGLRAWYKWQLLQHYSGKAADNQLLGFPIIDELITTSDNWKLPRNTFAECVKSIMDDLDIAIANLPGTYADSTGKADWNATMGARFQNRITGDAAVVLKSRVALLAASPAFNLTDADVLWENAAKAAGPLLKTLGALLPAGKTFYTATSNKEIIWNRAQRSIRSWETNNFPPSLFGRGNTNPSQNLVDAFPMKNGYPITHESSIFDQNNPYAGRDTRLGDYIIYNSLNFKSVINTFIGAPLDGINVLETSTRTGYYLKKFMASGVNLKSGSEVSTSHTYTLARMTELLLNYCEAANEAWGPDGDPEGYGFTARTKIRDLRIRAGITQPDAYLNSLDTDGLRALIRNERRIELCFEGFRFWDIRRWNDITTMQAPVKGAYLTQNGATYSFSYEPVENRLYSNYMIYGPIPYNETLKYNIVQNNGW